MVLLHIWSRYLSSYCFCSVSLSVCLHKRFKSMFFLLYSSVGLLDMFSCWFSKPNVLGACLSCTGPKDWGALCGGQIPCSSGKKFLIFEIHPDCWSSCLRWGFWRECVSDSPTHLDEALLSFLVRVCLSGFIVSMGGGTFRVSLHYHLDLPMSLFAI